MDRVKKNAASGRALVLSVLKNQATDTAPSIRNAIWDSCMILCNLSKKTIPAQIFVELVYKLAMNRQTFAEYLHNEISSAQAVRFSFELVEVKRKRWSIINGNGFTATVVISDNCMRAKFDSGHGITFRRNYMQPIGYTPDALARVQVV